MTKLLGSILVLCGGGGMWYLLRGQRRRRRQVLSELLFALRRMGEGIRQERLPLPRLLEDTAAACTGEVAAFLRTAADTSSGDTLSQRWCRAVDALPLAAEEQYRLVRLGNSLRGDAEHICKAISLAVYDLAKTAEELERRQPEQERKSSALCFCTAALLVILLL